MDSLSSNTAVLIPAGAIRSMESRSSPGEKDKPEKAARGRKPEPQRAREGDAEDLDPGVGAETHQLDRLA